MVDDLAGGPLAGPGPGVELLRRNADERFGDHPIAILVLRDQLLPFVWLHVTLVSWQCRGRDPLARSPGRDGRSSGARAIARTPRQGNLPISAGRGHRD